MKTRTIPKFFDGEMVSPYSKTISFGTDDISIGGSGGNDDSFIPGDVNGNGKIDAGDYAMAKRAYLRTFTLNADQLKRGDINKNGKIDASEYAMIKRHFLRTYVIPGAEGK